MPNTVKYFASDANLEAATAVAKTFASGGAIVKPIGREVLAAIELGEMPQSTYDRLARMCNNKNIDHKRNAQMARELSQLLFGIVIAPSK
jgi:hypothetical protein